MCAEDGTAVLSCTATGTATACEATGSVGVADGDFLQFRIQETTGNPATVEWKGYVTLATG